MNKENRLKQLAEIDDDKVAKQKRRLMLAVRRRVASEQAKLTQDKKK